MSLTLIRGDARSLPLAGDSVDLIVTSPPYFAQRSYQDAGQHYEGQIGSEDNPHDFLDALLVATAEMARVLKPAGSIWVNLGDKYCSPGGHTDNTASSRLEGRRAQRLQGRADRATTGHGVKAKSLFGLPARYMVRCIDELGLILRRDQIWEKSNPLPESVTDRTRTDHEYWFHFTKRGRYFASLDGLRTPASDYQRSPAVRAVPAGQRPRKMTDSVNAAGRLPGSVWRISTQPLTVPEALGVDHYAAFPMEWPRRLISGWCPAGGVVLDPFGGTGTTALVADVMGRRGIAVEMSGDYCRVARWRTSDPGQRASAMQVDKPDVPAGMDSLLDLIEDHVA